MPPPPLISPSDRVLVTGSNGFLGVAVVRSLLARGCSNLRCFVRPSSKLERLREALDSAGATERTEIIRGDLLSRDDCRRAAADVSVICHLAAGFDKSFAGAFMNSALATRNLIEAFLELGKPARFVNVSSFAVYSNLGRARGALLDETSPIEDNFQERGDAYGFGKLKQEQLVRAYGESRGLPFVILRPGTIYGPGKRDLTGRIGIDTFGFFIHLGGSNHLPMTYVDNCADAVVLAALEPGVDGETFNVVDDETLTSRQFLKAYKSRVRGFFSVPLPFFVTRSFCQLWEGYSRWSKGQLPPAFNRRRCAAEWNGNRFSNTRIHQRLGWQPRVGLERAMAAFLAQFDSQPGSPSSN